MDCLRSLKDLSEFSFMRKVFIYPVVTEKAATSQAVAGRYVFFTELDANKFEIKSAVESLKSGIEVVDVKTSIVRGKVKRVGRSVGKRVNRKKATVRLKKGQTLELFES